MYMKIRRCPKLFAGVSGCVYKNFDAVKIAVTLRFRVVVWFAHLCRQDCARVGLGPLAPRGGRREPLSAGAPQLARAHASRHFGFHIWDDYPVVTQ
jgi:hypothetical protein